MKYTLDKTAYIITKDNYRFLNAIFNNYWKSNGYKFIDRHGITDIIDLYHRNNDIIDLYHRNKALITQYTACIVASDGGTLYLSEADYRQTIGYKVVNLNFKNLMKVE